MPVLQNATTANPSFVADAWGTYMVQLVVSAGWPFTVSVRFNWSWPPLVPERPTGPVNHQGLSSSCLECHSDELDALPGPGKIQGKSPNHIAASSMCETCHTPLGFDIIPYVDHQEVFGNCSQCHNGVLAVGKSEFHTPTNAECDDCHNTTSFLTLNADGSFDHTGITRSCSGCHNGTVAIGKTPTDPRTPDTTSECGNLPYNSQFPRRLSRPHRPRVVTRLQL